MTRDAKLYIRITSKLNDELDDLADQLSMTKASLVSYLLSKAVKTEKKQLDLLDQMKDPDYLSTVLNGLTDATLSQFKKE